MTHLVQNSNRAIYSLAFKTLLSLAIAAVPALIVATILGITLVTAVDEAKQDFERAMSASRRLAEIRVLVEKELGLVSRIPAELDLKNVDCFRRTHRLFRERAQGPHGAERDDIHGCGGH